MLCRSCKQQTVLIKARQKFSEDTFEDFHSQQNQLKKMNFVIGITAKKDLKSSIHCGNEQTNLMRKFSRENVQ